MVRSLDQALVFLRAACKGGDPPGCAGLGGLLLDGNTEDAYEEARSSLDKACTAGDAMGCNNLAGIYEDGLGVPVDGTRARKLYETACDKGSGMGCSTLAKALAEDADEQTRARSAKLFERAKEILQRGCYEGSARACGQVGWFYERGLGTKLDLPQAVSMYKSGCDGNDGASCFNLALTRRQASSNDSTIGPLLERACSLGLAEACTMLKTDPVLERDPAVLHPAAPAPDPPKPAAR